MLLLQNADGAIFTTLPPSPQSYFFQKGPLNLVDARKQVHSGFAAPVTHRLRPVEPANGLEAGDIAVRPLAGIDHVAEPGVEYLVLAGRFVRQIKLGMGLAAGPPRIIGLDRHRQMSSDRFPRLRGLVQHYLRGEVAAPRKAKFDFGH